MIHKAHNKGFTLIEVLIAMAIFGIAVIGMYGVFTAMQATTINQSELIDVQQNLRVAGDFISRDIKMAAALIPAGNTGVTAGSNATTLNLATATTLDAYALISSDIEVPASTANTANFIFTTADSTSVDFFSATDSVRIIRPQNGNQPYGVNDLIVSSVDRTVPRITINSFNNPANAIQYKAGDIIVRFGGGAASGGISAVSWTWNNATLDLSRTRDGVTNVMATDINNMSFSYLLDNGAEIVAPTAAELTTVNAVRITLTANTTQQYDRQTRTRSLSSVTYLRNK